MSGLFGTLASGGFLTLLVAAAFGFGFALVAGQGRRRSAMIGGLCAVLLAAILSASPVFRANMAGAIAVLFVLGLLALPVMFYAIVLRRIRRRNAPTPNPQPAGLRLIEQDDALFRETLKHLRDENARQPDYSRQTFSIAWRDERGAVLASVRCEILMGLAEMRALYVQPEMRAKGLGRQVLQAALDEAKSRGSARALLHTFDWQVPDFYRHLGWTRTGEVSYPAGPRRIQFEKQL